MQIEVYPARDGWCVPDMPLEGDVPIYSMPDAERPWTRLLALYRSALAWPDAAVSKAVSYASPRPRVRIWWFSAPFTATRPAAPVPSSA